MVPTLVMMALGTFRFGMFSGAYDQFSRSASYRWNNVDRIGREPALQYLGPGTTEISIEGLILPHFRGGLGQVDRMCAQAEAGDPMMMVDGLGKVWKWWVIVRVDDRRSHMIRDGAARKIEFSMTLKSYGGDAGDRREALVSNDRVIALARGVL